LVQKFSKEQGANILIPEEDMYKVDSAKLDVNELQMKIQEQEQRKRMKL